jgi:hypothetical protein
MIRRNKPLGDRPREWLLISQVEHARLSRILADHWGNGDMPPVICAPQESNPALLQIRREALACIERHDDGWTGWEAAPAIDPADGRPFDFMEMPQADSLVIWTRSIHAACDEGPLAGAMTAGHFLALLANTQHEQNSVVTSWRKEMETRRATWLREWHEQDVELHSDEVADHALRWLQACDRLSLWLCCKCPAYAGDVSIREAPLELAVPARGNAPIRFRYVAAGAEGFVAAEPWPFESQELEIMVSCDAVPTDNYRSTEELLLSRRPAKLHWHIQDYGHG